MSEYQFFKFKTIDASLSNQQRRELRSISNRAHIDSNSFNVEYHYSSLSTDPQKVMLDYFDIGFNFANWGETVVYMRLPSMTVPPEILESDDFEFTVINNEEWQLLTFSLEQGTDYVSEQQADELMQHIATLHQNLINGDWRMIYLMWLRRLDYDDEINPLPAISFDFVNLPPALHAFSQLFEVRAEWIRALAMTLTHIKCHQPQISSTEFGPWLASLSAQSKNNLLKTIFEQGSLTKQQALTLTKASVENTPHHHWLNHQSVRANFTRAQAQLNQQRAEANAIKQAEENARRTKHLTEVYQQRDSLWQQSQTEANRACASSYDLAAHLLHELAAAYRLKQQPEQFEYRFSKFIQNNQKRKALIKRLTDLIFPS